MKNKNKQSKKNIYEYNRYQDEIEDMQLIDDKGERLTADEDALLTVGKDASLANDGGASSTADEKTAPKNKVIESFKHDQKPVRLRFFAAVVDCLIISVLYTLSNHMFGAPDWGKYLQMAEVVAGLPAKDPLVLERMSLYQYYFILSLTIGLVYDALMMMIFKGSLGKLIFGLRVVDAKEGRKVWLSKLLLLLRATIKGVSIYLLAAIPFLFMCLTTFGNEDRRSGFDMFSGTKVISVRKRKDIKILSWLRRT